MQVVITGSRGMLGSALINAFCKVHDVKGYDQPDMDITSFEMADLVINGVMPDLVINAAAYTNVDGCETNPDQAFSVNAMGPRNLAVICRKLNIPLVHVSTDYVFGGNSEVPYKEDDVPKPQSVYGCSKLQGENFIRQICPKHYIIRTAWLFGKWGKNFVDTVIRMANESDQLKIVSDQVGSPTYAVDLAEAILLLVKNNDYGTYHITNSGVCSWYEFTLDILRFMNITGVKVTPICSEKLQRPAKRPGYSVLDNGKWKKQVAQPLRSYLDALKDYLDTYKEEK